MEICLSNSDINEALDGRVKIIKYNDMKRFKNLEELLSPHNAIIMLYESAPGFGHWVLLLFQPEFNRIEFFDSYGIKPDMERFFIPKLIRPLPLLSMLIIKFLDKHNAPPLDGRTKISFHYNEIPFQMQHNNVNTCGRHCINRMNHSDIPLNKYQSLIKNLGTYTGLNPDEIVTINTDT